MKSIQFAAALVATLIAGSVFAQTNTPNIDKRQEIQQKRVAKGMESGALTAKESTNLEKRETKIEADKQAAKADGVVTGAERAKLEKEEKRTNRKIRIKKHNASATTN